MKCHVYHHVGGKDTHLWSATNVGNPIQGRDISSPAIWATKISANFGNNNVAQMSRQICSHTPSALNAGAKRSDVQYGHASMLLLVEGNEATESYNKYANFSKYIS